METASKVGVIEIDGRNVDIFIDLEIRSYFIMKSDGKHVLRGIEYLGKPLFDANDSTLNRMLDQYKSIGVITFLGGFYFT